MNITEIFTVFIYGICVICVLYKILQLHRNIPGLHRIGQWDGLIQCPFDPFQIVYKPMLVYLFVVVTCAWMMDKTI